MIGLRPRRLIRFYPRWWRERYGDEFMDLVGEQPVGWGVAINIVAGAIDARLSGSRPEAAEKTAAGPAGGVMVMNALRRSCGSSAGLSTRDSMLGAGVILGVTVLSVVLGSALGRAGFETLGEVIMSVGFPAAVLLSMPVTYLKGQPLRVQAALIGGPMIILALIAWVTAVAA